MADNFDQFPADEKEAIVGILFACMTSDAKLPEQETESLAHLLLIKEMFRSNDVLSCYRNAMMQHSHVGTKPLIDECRDKISADMRPTVFAMAADLMLSDGKMEIGEDDTLHYLSDALAIPAEQREKIIEVMMIKNRGNRII